MKQLQTMLNDTNPEVAVGLTEINNIVREETKGAPVVAPWTKSMAGKEVTAEQVASQLLQKLLQKVKL